MRRIGIGIVVVVLAIAELLLAATPATAVTWELGAAADQGLVCQYFDRDSIQWSGTQVTVKSYYMDERSAPQRIDYLTAYNCATNQFQDIEINGQPTGSDWQPLVADPLNEAIRDLLCPAMPL
ncbi:hypothetical protein [Acaryochloris sp. IP29b_bin.148]|uniref:hypothetical protein n=1 Tax=Acaryochloris sp. IP29b_bin.148 TaxID=2969218 RepID=UPI002630FCF1|nr:hypothetical protein [Acaryochloris sp. IP29b_bin.148]